MQPGDLVGGRYRIVRQAGVGGMATEGEAQIRLVDAETLWATGQREAARAALAAAVERVRARAARFNEPELRASFLARAPENARTLGLVASWAAES